jgi:hypothetical protein
VSVDARSLSGMPPAPAAGSSPATVLALYRVSYACGGVTGFRLLFAPDGRSAARTLRQHPSVFGLAHERVVVLSAVQLPFRPQRAAA